MKVIVKPITIEEELKSIAQIEFDSAAAEEKSDCCNAAK